MGKIIYETAPKVKRQRRYVVEINYFGWHVPNSRRLGFRTLRFARAYAKGWQAQNIPARVIDNAATDSESVVD